MSDNDAGTIIVDAGQMHRALNRDPGDGRWHPHTEQSIETRFIRHPEGFPARISRTRRYRDGAWRAKGRGGRWGLLLRFKRLIQLGTPLSVAIDAGGERHRFHGEVVVARPSDSRFEVGLCVGDEDEGFRLRMVEQLLHIEAYRQRIEQREGRMLSPEGAAREWIERYAWSFPGL
jgi:hypothetical protein